MATLFDNPSNLFPLLGLVQGLVQAGAPSPYPVGWGQAIGQAGSGLMQGMAQGQTAQYQQERLRQMQEDRALKLQMENERRKFMGLPPIAAPEGGSDVAPFSLASALGLAGLFGDDEDEKPATGAPMTATAGTGDATAPMGMPAAMGAPAASPLAQIAAQLGMDPQVLAQTMEFAPGLLPMLMPQEPEVRSVGRALVQIDPRTGEVREIYRAPSEGGGAPRAPLTSGLPEGYMWGPDGTAMPIPGLPPQQPQPEYRTIGGRLVQIGPDGTVSEVYSAPDETGVSPGSPLGGGEPASGGFGGWLRSVFPGGEGAGASPPGAPASYAGYQPLMRDGLPVMAGDNGIWAVPPGGGNPVPIPVESLGGIVPQRLPTTSVSVNTASEIGSIPAGWEVFTTPEGGRSMRPIAGGPAAAEIKAAEDKAASTAAGTARTADIVTEDIDRAMGLIQSAGVPTTGLVGATTRGIPGTPAADLAALLNTIKANVGFDKLQQMRAASPTGGALGQVSDFENRMLQSVAGALEQSQTEEQLLYNLRRLRDMYNIVVNEGEGSLRRYLGEAPAQQPGAPSPGTVEDGYRFKGGDPADPNSWEPVR